jgi:hypothetical protein
MRRFRAVIVLLLVVAAGLGSAAAGTFSAPAAPAQLRVDTTHADRAPPQDHPGSALMRRLLGNGDGSMTITPAAHRPHKVGSGAAGRSALAWERIGHGSRVLGTALAYVTQLLPPSRPQLVWLVSLDLAGGLTNPGGPSTGAPGPDNLIVAFVDATTGQVGVTSAGYSALLPPLPVIRG